EAVETAVQLSRKHAYMRKGVPEEKVMVVEHRRIISVVEPLEVIRLDTVPESPGGFGPYLEGVDPTLHDNGSA
ncbi:hypothetical protein F5141DRAFT_1002462, partial [Pisolithus sp. B1]